MSGPFVDRYRAVVEPLYGRRFTEADGFSEAELDAVPSRTGYELPEALYDFYTLVGRFEPATEAHHRFYPPGHFTRGDGKLVFCEENQVVLYWGYDEDQAWRSDPPVYQGLNNDADLEWYIDDARCSHFLIGMIYWQALNGGLPYVRFAEVSDTVRQAASAWPLVWQDEDCQVYSRGSSVFCLTPCASSGVEVQAAGLSERELGELFRALISGH